MMDKETFVKIIELMRKQYVQESKFVEGIENIVDGRFICMFDMLGVSKTIWEAFDIEMYDWVSWYLWDNNGIEGDLKEDKSAWCQLSNAKEYQIHTPSELYELIKMDKTLSVHAAEIDKIVRSIKKFNLNDYSLITIGTKNMEGSEFEEFKKHTKQKLGAEHIHLNHPILFYSTDKIDINVEDAYF